MYACPQSNLVIYLEVSEHQHGGIDYQCDEKRMSDLYDETPGALVIFIHFNPHGYKDPKGRKKSRKVEVRLETLLATLEHIIYNETEIRNEGLLQCYYLFYSMDNPNVAKNIPKKFIYLTDEIFTKKQNMLKDQQSHSSSEESQ